MGFILLHMLDGTLLYVRVEELLVVSSPRPNMNAPGTGSNILVHDQWFAVKETPGQVIAKAEPPSD